MYLVGYKEDCQAEYIRELLRTELPGKQLRYAIDTLKSDEYVPQAVRKICIGAYILLRQEPDPLYNKLKADVNRTNRHIERNERDQLLELLNRLDLKAITAQFGDRSDQAASASSSSPQSHLTNGGTATCTDAHTDAACGQTQTHSEVPEPLYNKHAMLNAPYVELLQRFSINVWGVQECNERPVEVMGQLPESELKEKLLAENPRLAKRLLLFMRYKQLSGPLVYKNLSLSSGSLWQELDYRFSRLHVPLPFIQWTGGRGTVGLFLQMRHPRLGDATLMLTCAHVVFKQLVDATDAQIDEFNESFDYSHYDRCGQTAGAGMTNNLDFCILEVPHNQLHTVANMAPTGKLRDFNMLPICSRTPKIVKFGWVTGLTSGNFMGHNYAINGSTFTVVSEEEPNVFAEGGDSGAILLYEDTDTHTFVPVAILKGNYKDPELGRLHCACSIIDILRKYVQKRTRSTELPPEEEVLAAFTACGPDIGLRPRT